MFYFFFCCCCYVDIDECQWNIDECDINASCNNTEGSYQCTCNSGYWGSGLNCTGKRFTSLFSVYCIHAATTYISDILLYVFCSFFCFHFTMITKVYPSFYELWKGNRNSP